jgi:holliday junction DNA helicase RuvB
MLFVGGPGLGKTMLAQLAAKELGVTLHERLAQVVNFVGVLNGLLLQAGDKEIVFLDEIHELLPTVQTVLYRAMEGQRITLRTRDDKSVTMPLKDFTVIGATTDEYRLLGPLRDRFKVVLPFTTYDDESLTQIVLQRAHLSSMPIDPDVAPEIAKRSKGTPRLAIRLLESCFRYARSRGDDQVTMAHFEQTVRLDGIDPLGLGPDEQRFVKFLMNQRGRPVRLFTIEAAIGVHRRTIQEVIEPFLLRKGLIERTQHGRVITEAGIKHCEAIENAVEGSIA